MPAHLLCVALVLAQAPNASLYGTVRDSETGRPVAEATVALVDGGAGSISDDAGHYTLLSVPAGPWHLRFSALGYRSRTLHVFVPADGRVQVDVALLPEPIPLEPLEARVDADPGGSGRGMGDRVRRVGSRRVSYNELRTNPGLAEPDVLEVLGGRGVLLDPEAPNGLHVRGGASDQNLFVLDGVPILSPYHGLGRLSAVGPDAIGRVELHAAVPPVVWGDALSGVVDLRTRRPGTEHVRVRGAATAAGVRLSADGPLPVGAGVLLSGGWGQPGFLVPSSEDSYVHGSFRDGLAKVEWPSELGLIWVLGFYSGNSLRMRDIAAPAEGDGSGVGDARAVSPAAEPGTNRFSWRSSSYGVGWQKPISEEVFVDAQVWRADLDVRAGWRATGGALRASGRRRALGYRARLSIDGAASRSLVGVSLEHERTAFDVVPAACSQADRNKTEAFALRAEPSILAVFAEQQRVLLSRVEVLVGLRASAVLGARVRVAPRASLHWPISSVVSASAGYSRTYQWAQSLRNPESLMDHLLSAELPIHVGADGVPAARADQLTLAFEARPALGIELGLSTFARDLEGLVLVAPGTGQPFAVDRFSVGGADVWGVNLDLELRRARYRALASYGFTSVYNETRGSEYRPGFATTHSLLTAIGYYPTGKLELRSSLRVELGRRATLMDGPFTWEACSVLEGGCEAEGSPGEFSGPLGDQRLPPYLRVDIGVRKHWHSRILGREGRIAAFVTLSNVLDSRNVLGYVLDPATGRPSRLPMRPFSPLAAGLEWRF